jgi:hypothetical protein
MTARILHQDNSHALLIRERECMQQELQVAGIPLGQLQKKALPRGRFDGTIQIAVLALVLP